VAFLLLLVLMDYRLLLDLRSSLGRGSLSAMRSCLTGRAEMSWLSRLSWLSGMSWLSDDGVDDVRPILLVDEFLALIAEFVGDFGAAFDESVESLSQCLDGDACEIYMRK
jgi:hypothetical protein